MVGTYTVLIEGGAQSLEALSHDVSYDNARKHRSLTSWAETTVRIRLTEMYGWPGGWE